MGNFYTAHYTERKELQKKFGRKLSLKSKYKPNFPMSVEREFLRVSRAIYRELWGALEPIIAGALLAVQRGETIPDLGYYAVSGSSRKKIEKIGTQLTNFAIKQWKLVTKRTLDIDINNAYYQGMFEALIKDWEHNQIHRIQQRIDETIADIYAVLDEAGTGVFDVIPIGTVAENVRHEYEKLQSGLEFVARDSTGNMFSQMIMLMAIDAMSEQYIWSTKMDGRERPAHAARNGHIFRWDDPPIGGAPGEDYNCRCIGWPVFRRPY